jgi:hypothetical protein
MQKVKIKEWYCLVLILIMVLSFKPLFAEIGWHKAVISDDFSGAADVFAIDLDGDGDIDVLGAAYTDNKISWWENDGNPVPTFTEHMITDGYGNASSVYALDLDGDGDIDVLGAGNTANEISWWENDGNENFTKHTIGSFNGANCVFAIDLDEDGDIDVLGAGSGANQIAWWENDGNENFTKHVIASFTGAKDVYAIDLDSDGDIDVLGANLTGNTIAWWENDGNENFVKYNIDTNCSGAFDVFAIDLDEDGDIDVLGAALNANRIYWYENDGNENFIRYNLSGVFNGARSAYAIDLDQDGAIDVLGAAYSAQEYAWWKNDGDQNFTKYVIDAYSFPENFRPDEVYSIDLDGDGDLDVLGAIFSGSDNILCWQSDLILYDVSPVSIDIPSLVPENTTLSPQTTVNNNGTSSASFDIWCSIEPGGYMVSTSVTNLSPGASEQVTFPVDFTFVSGFYTVGVQTFFADDQIPDNNFLEKVIEAATVDVAPVSIDIPSTLPEDTALNPQATVKNLGSRTETFTVRCTIEPGDYTKTQTVSNLDSGDSVQVTFTTQFTFESGLYTVTVFTMHGSDENPANDTLEKVIEATGIAEDNTSTPYAFSFNAPTMSRDGSVDVMFTLPASTYLDLMVYDVTGRLSKTVVSQRYSAGKHSISVDLGIPAGVYFYRLNTASGERVTQKLLIIE